MAKGQEKNTWLDAVTRMIELTQQGKLKWTSASPSKLPNDENRTSAVFVSKYKSRYLRLYSTRVENTVTDYTAARFGVLGIGIGQTTPPKWRRKIILEFIDFESATLWSFPEVDALADLLAAVQYQVAGVSEFLDDIFNEPEVSTS